MLYFVYDIVDPRDAQPFYVGMTNNPNQRMLQHLAGRDMNERKSTRISEIQASGLQPRMRILEITEDVNEVREKEVHWIRTYEKQGIQLTNIQNATLPWENRPRQQEQLIITPESMEPKPLYPYWYEAPLIEKTADQIVPRDQIYNGHRWRPLQVHKVEQRGPRFRISYIDDEGRDVTRRYKPDYPFSVLTQPLIPESYPNTSYLHL